MSKIYCSQCGGDEIIAQRAKGWGGVALLLGVLLVAVGFTRLQIWFPSATFWQDFIMSGSLSIPEAYTWADFMKYILAFAAIAGLGVALAGFGIWLVTTPVFECKSCGHKEWGSDDVVSGE